MRHEASFLKDVLTSCLKMEAIVAASSEDSFLRDEVAQAAVLHRNAGMNAGTARL